MSDDQAAGGSEAPGASEPIKPMLRIMNADATPEEIAAIVAVFAALGGGEAPAAPRRPLWNAPHRMVRPAVIPGQGGWRPSSLPR